MQNENNKTTKYPLATAGKRIIAKALDIAIISCLVIALGFAIFCTDPNFIWNEQLALQQNWRYGLFVTVVAILFFGLMLLLPRLWGKTIGMKAFKLSYYKRNEGMNYTFGLFKHEIFVWEVIVFIALAMGWTLSFLSQHQITSLLEGVNSIFANNVPEGLDKVCYYVGTGFSCLYGLSILFLIAIIIATCIKSGRPAFHDKYSFVYIFYRNVNDKIKSVSNLHKDNLSKENEVPGVISADSFEEIDNI